MNWRILSVGKPSFPWVLEGVDTYLKRLTRFAPVELVTLKKGDADSFLRALEPGIVVALDERGTDSTTAALAEEVTGWELDRVKQATVCIGGADGLPKEVRQRADRILRFGRMTLMHELALLVWMEQLYRIHTLKADHPYHREG
jgi:23S rRNA (pseudouridine1915-N3)-methyltransferase